MYRHVRQQYRKRQQAQNKQEIKITRPQKLGDLGQESVKLGWGVCPPGPLPQMRRRVGLAVRVPGQSL